MFYVAILFFLIAAALANIGVAGNIMQILWIVSVVLSALAILFLFVPSPVVIRRDSPPL